MEARRKRLEAVFADDPYLSATMRASRLHERDGQPRPAPFAVSQANYTSGRAGPEKERPQASVSPQTAASPVASQSATLGFLVSVSQRSGKLAASLAAAPERDVMTAKEAAAFLRVGLGTLRAWVRERGLPSAMIGSQRRFRKEALLAWLAVQESST
jgi:excisionase family DNA binding protein